jgi:23S rRNA (cytidine1920-2'-O)/16S rRNA (cytidine1409-2'-O)-methyltransferase
MIGMHEKIRLDVLLTERGLIESRSLAQRMVMAGQVRVAGQVVLKPAIKVPSDAEVTVDKGPKFVSRGGEKLEGALLAFGLTDLAGRVCADVGASTGGFTDCLLQSGAQKVYSIDVGYGELHWKLRNDPRVVVMERTNARFVEKLPEPVGPVVIDASFISLKIFFPVIRNWFGEAGGEAVMLIKPQFEAGRSDVSRGDGVIRDPRIHRQVLLDVLEAARQGGFALAGLIRSPLVGPKGNAEFLAHLRYPAVETDMAVELTALVDAVLPEA